MATSIQTRADLTFQFDNQALGDTHITYHLTDFLVRVEKQVGSEPKDNEIRYGVMVDIEGDDSYWKNSYIMEIPVKASTAKGRQQAQEEIIKQYINEMRDKFQTFYAQETSVTTTDEFDKMKRTLNSADGRWNVSRNFRKSHLTPFVDWLFDITVKDKEDVKSYLIRSRMAFETEQKYIVAVDWASPYIIFKDESLVSHMASGKSSNALTYFPFHGFAWQKAELCTQISIDRDKDYPSAYKQGIKLRPSNYALFAFYTHVMDEISRLQQDNFDALKPYYVYVQNLGVIAEKLITNSPLAKMTDAEKDALLTEEIVADWDGDTHDVDRKNHLAHMVLGIQDVISAKELFGKIIQQETISGRNSNRRVSIEILAHSLKTSFLNNDVARENYEDLWTYNDDDYGVNLIIHKMFLILSKMSEATDVYREFVKSNLFEHPVLEDTAKGYRDAGLQTAEWSNMLYRSNNILWDVCMAFYVVREEALKFKQATVFQSKVVPKTLPPNAVSDWITKNVIFPDAVAGKSTPSQLYNEWKLGDVQVRKLANYLLDGGQIDNLKSVERQFAQAIKEIMGNKWFKAVPFDKMDLIHKKLLDVKLSLMGEIPPAKIAGMQNSANVASAAINLLLANVVYDNAYKKDASFEAKLRAHTVAIGVFSDVANTVAKFKGIEATLVRSVAQKAGGRAAVGLGIAQFVGGGVGGVLGTLWFAYDGALSYGKGFEKDAMLDSISAVGCGLGAIGMMLNGTVVGLPIGVVCNIASFTLVLGAQALKYSRVFNSETEDYCKYLNGESIENGGMDRFSVWEREMGDLAVSLPLDFLPMDRQSYIVNLIERADEFITNGDTYDGLEESL
ncbi:hypothetical protein A9Q81_22890 [Gammaproteobacteria bacterium 42_54_T18]|nr:hypothetical protein A9Q81_22890 [Gammaproteobacteria bacterium 42_54_T18]